MTTVAAYPAGPVPERPRDEPIDDDALPLVSADFERHPMRFVWHVARGRYWRWLSAMLLGEAAHAACGILLPYALGQILAAVTGQGERPLGLRLEALRTPIFVFMLLCLGELACGRINAALQLRVAPRQRQYVARSLFAYLHGHSHRFLTANFAGALAHRISETSHGVNQVLWAILTEFWPMTIVVVVSNLLLWAASPWLGLFTASWSLLFVMCSLLMSRRTQPLAAAAASARSHTMGVVVDSVSNHASVRLFAALAHERRRLNRVYAGELRTVLEANHAMERVRGFQFAASAVLKAGVVGLSVYLWSRGSIDVSKFVMAVSLSLLIIAEVRNLGRRFLELFDYLGNVGSGVRAIVRQHELVDGREAAERAIEQGVIAFEGVDFGYDEGAKVFQGLSVSIPAGQRVGLVGLSGSGKSTFVSLLLRLYDPQAGSIRIDGHDLRALTQESLHRQVGLIPQDPTLFHRTLRENIRFGRGCASDAEVERAAQKALAHDFISQLTGGYDAEVGERGVKLSGGQRQRIAIARVILKNAPVLILDEATSSLDTLTERAIQQTLDEAMKGKTVIVIAHRLSTIAHLDRILVFSQGRITEDGDHAQLLARQGAYHALWTGQVAGALSQAVAAE
jgi:ATP-binding cassette subfamily B protein